MLHQVDEITQSLRQKDQLYHVLDVELGYFCPPKNRACLGYLQDILVNKKGLLKKSAVSYCNKAPAFAEITLEVLYRKSDEEVKFHLPDWNLKSRKKKPCKLYVWIVFQTMRPVLASRLLEFARRQRDLQRQKKMEVKNIIHISEKWLKEFKKVNLTQIPIAAGKKATAFVDVKARKPVDYSKRRRYEVLADEFADCNPAAAEPVNCFDENGVKPFPVYTQPPVIEEEKKVEEPAGHADRNAEMSSPNVIGNAEDLADQLHGAHLSPDGHQQHFDQF